MWDSIIETTFSGQIHNAESNAENSIAIWSMGAELLKVFKKSLLIFSGIDFA